jgi:succinate-semialdehyde dehydrogenase/glutarate-semialdehyde dehydrogenase
VVDIEQIVAKVPKTAFIGGVWIDAPPTLDVVNPATGTPFTQVTDSTPGQAMQALAAATDAQTDWAATNPRDRSELLRAAFEKVVQRTEEFATLMTLEMGKSLHESRGEVTYGAEFLRWFAEEAPRVHGRYAIAPQGGSRLITIKQPVGPTLAITPWNFPLAMATRKIGPALAAGCTVVFKPAKATPLTALLLVDVLREVGLPPGVVNCFVASSASATTGPLIADARLRKVTFTGSTAVGRKLIEQSAGNVLRISLELGGNAPFLVLPSADVDRAVEGAVQAKMRNIGEACTAANRFIVHSSLAEQFTTRLAERLAALRVGDGLADGTEVGPLITAEALANVEALVNEAVADGARVVTGGARVGGPGYFMQPTVLADVRAHSRLCREEIFGPVAPVLTFDEVDQAVELANDTEFGLIGYVFAEDISEALGVAERLQTGMIGLNSGVVSNPAAPFGGVKASGLGREGGFEGIEEYLETKYIGLAL